MNTFNRQYIGEKVYKFEGYYFKWLGIKCILELVHVPWELRNKESEVENKTQKGVIKNSYPESFKIVRIMKIWATPFRGCFRELNDVYADVMT